MAAALRVLILIGLFVLPWLLMKINNGEAFMRNLVGSQPLLVGILLLPGILLSIAWIVKELKR